MNDEMRVESFYFPVPREVMINANTPLNFRVKSIMIKALRDMGEDIAREHNIETMFDKYKVVVYVSPPSKRRLDPPNLYPTVKPIIDGMTDANVWEDDDWEHMESMTFKYGGLSPVKDIFLLEIKVIELKGDE